MLRPLLEFLYPPTCLNCARLLQKEETDLCGRCRSEIERVDPDSAWATAARERLMTGSIFSDVLCLYLFTEESPLRPMIHALKYRGFSRVGRRLGQELGRALLERKIGADLILAVPLSRQRERERGFNQAQEIAAGLSSTTGIPCEEGAVLRIRDTASQTLLTYDQRKQNIHRAFGVSASGIRHLAGRRCLLVDDVITTGATIVECATSLRRAGATDIVACAIAFAR